MKTVYTCFCTDVIHDGHLNIIKEAKKFGSVTIGALSDKALIRYNKFPTISLEERIKLYESLEGVDRVVVQNSMMYDDYSQAYLDIMDDDPNTHSYNQFLHLGTEINDDNTERYANIFKRRKDYYRRYRDLSYIVLVGVYALQIVDAFVDASLSDFDISSDLSMSVAPTVINLPMYGSNMKTTALGIRCCINF